jgi:hypothetical protein
MRSDSALARREVLVRTVLKAIRPLVETMEPRQLLASVSGVVYNDANTNGRRDAGETGVAGQTLFADYDYDGVLDTGEPSVLTDTAGNAVLTVAEKPFALRSIFSNGYTGTAVHYFVPDGNGGFRSSGSSFGVTPVGTASILLSYFPDQNNDGIQQPGLETILANEVFDYGATAFIDLNANGILDGEDVRPFEDTGHVGTLSYSFPGLAPGTYRVVVASNLPAGQSIRGGATQIVTLGGQGIEIRSAVLGVDFSKTRLSVLAFRDSVVVNGKYDEGERLASGTKVFADYNYNGIQDADEPGDTIGEEPVSPGAAIASPPEVRLLVRTGPVSLRFVKPDGTPARLAYGATSLWLTLPDEATKTRASVFIH